MNLDRIIRKTIKDLKPYQPGKPIQEVQRELGLTEIHKMASNENPLGPSPQAIAALQSELKNLNRYPETTCYYLKEELAKFWNLKPDNFIIGNGSDEIIVLALRAFLNAGEEVIVSKPTFLIYEIASKIEGADLKIVGAKNFRYDLEAIRKNITNRTKIIFIANPDNPCGTYLTKDEVNNFIESVPSEIVLFFDEAYYEFIQGADYPETLKFIEDRPLIITHTFSKIYGLAGLRVGYGIAAPEVVRYLDKVREPFNVNSLAQVAALNALKDRDFVQRGKKIVQEGKEYLYQEFERLGLDYIKSWTNFILVKIGSEASNLVRYLLNRGIIVRNMAAWELNEYIRVTVGLEEENKKLIKLLKSYLNKEVRK